MRIALAMIVKGDEVEAELLDRCLGNVAHFVDGIFVTATYSMNRQEAEPIEWVVRKYDANLSLFQWTKNFSEARNYNFSEVPKDYDYILWCDADDIFRGLENLKKILEENPEVDGFAFNYLYSFDEANNPIVVHKKTQLVRNDGCVTWKGALHEDLIENRSLNIKFVEDIERLHLSTTERTLESKVRNVEISIKEAEENPDDPRVYFNLANSHFGTGVYERALEEYLIFLDRSGSDDEKYIAHQRLGSVYQALGKRDQAITELQISIGMFPDLPDSYNLLGYLYSDLKMYDEAERYLLRSLVMKPQYHKMIVYNPRDYDYQPMLALAKVYFNKNRPDLTLPLLRGCAKIYPKDKMINDLVAEMEVETKRLGQVLETIAHIETLKDNKEKILYAIGKLSTDLQSHPAICRIRNKYIIKTESSGKDIAYYCGETKHIWNPEMAKTKGIGGSEEAVINLAKEWTELGYNVTVFNSCGVEPMVCDGVTYKPFWYYNAKDKYDITILWRHPGVAEYDLNTGKIFVDLHDVLPAGEFTEKRLAKIDKIFVKTNAHRILFPNIPDEKFAIIPNGQDQTLFEGFVSKIPGLLINTSSPDRSLDVLPKLFKKVKEQVPEARLKWAYGWEIYDNAFAGDKARMAWKDKVVKEMEEAGIENMGRLSQAECAKLYQEGVILAYPSEFYEIDCISVKKAQACGCVPITTDFAAFKESNKYGFKVHSTKTPENWSRPYQMAFGIEDEWAQEEWVKTVVKELRNPSKTKKMEQWARKFDWDKIALQWLDLI